MKEGFVCRNSGVPSEGENRYCFMWQEAFHPLEQAKYLNFEGDKHDQNGKIAVM